MPDERSPRTCADCGADIVDGFERNSLGLSVAPAQVAYLCQGCAQRYPSQEQAFASLRDRLGQAAPADEDGTRMGTAT